MDWSVVSETQWADAPEESLSKAYGSQGYIPLYSVLSSYKSLIENAHLIGQHDSFLRKGFRAIQVGHWSSFAKRVVLKKRGKVKEPSWVPEVVPNLFLYGANPFHGFSNPLDLDLITPMDLKDAFRKRNVHRHIVFELVWSPSESKALEDPCFEWAPTDVALDLFQIKPKDSKTDRMKWSDVRDWS
jgi:hypothetical protein